MFQVVSNFPTLKSLDALVGDLRPPGSGSFAPLHMNLGGKIFFTEVEVTHLRSFNMVVYFVSEPQRQLLLVGCEQLFPKVKVTRSPSEVMTLETSV